MNNNYVFNIKKDEDITQQNFMTETKALFVELYEKYLAKDNEKEIWKEYDGFCFNLIENEKKEKYNYYSSNYCTCCYYSNSTCKD